MPIAPRRVITDTPVQSDGHMDEGAEHAPSDRDWARSCAHLRSAVAPGLSFVHQMASPSWPGVTGAAGLSDNAPLSIECGARRRSASLRDLAHDGFKLPLQLWRNGRCTA